MKVVMGAGGNERMPGEKEFFIELKNLFPNVTFEFADTVELQKNAIQNADVFYGWPVSEVFNAANRLRWVHIPATGIEYISEIPELLASDVTLTNARVHHAPPMADHVIGMMLILAHRWKQLIEDQKNHKWEDLKYYGNQEGLQGRTVGIVSFGDIGMHVAQRAHSFGMNVYAVDKHEKLPSPYVQEVWSMDRLDDLLGISDWLIVAAPLTSETTGLIDQDKLAILKDGAGVIVISRGGIVDEKALIDNLKSGHVRCAGFDAMEKEPLDVDSPLWDMDNVVLTPHISSAIPEMFEGRRQIFRENLKRFLADEQLLFVCDKKSGY